jgi:hypothetical protein
MPTTQDEAQNIVRIIGKYLPADKAVDLAEELDEQVGQVTTNGSLKITLRMLRDIVEQEGVAPLSRNYVHSIKENKASVGPNPGKSYADLGR